MKSLMGYQLPLQGEGLGGPIFIDWKASAFLLLAGMPGSGKTVSLTSILAQQLAAGASVFIVDDRSKSIDFLWAKDLVMPGGWGCDSEEHAVATLAMVYKMGQDRAVEMAKLGFVNWLDMPDNIRFKPIFGIIDEAASLLVQGPGPEGRPEGRPDRRGDQPPQLHAGPDRALHEQDRRRAAVRRGPDDHLEPGHEPVDGPGRRA